MACGCEDPSTVVPRAESACKIDVYISAYRWLGMRWVGYPAPRLWLDRLGVTGPTGPLRWPTRLVVFVFLLLWKALALLTWPVRRAARYVSGLALTALKRTLPRGAHQYPGCGCIWRLKRWSMDPWAFFRVTLDTWSAKRGDALDRAMFTLTGDEAAGLISEAQANLDKAKAARAKPAGAPRGTGAHEEDGA